MLLSIILCFFSFELKATVCTADINKYGNPSNCACETYHEYREETGKCKKAEDSVIYASKILILLKKSKVIIENHQSRTAEKDQSRTLVELLINLNKITLLLNKEVITNTLNKENNVDLEMFFGDIKEAENTTSKIIEVPNTLTELHNVKSILDKYIILLSVHELYQH